jgi:uncharacterized phage-associated protein
MAYKAIDIANELLKRAAENGGGDLMTNLKLQKMLYYEQGFHLAFFNEALFEDPIEAWQYGPVVPNVYYYYKECGRNGIIPEEKEFSFEKENERALFDEVFRVYGAYSAIGLMNMTHSEMPWNTTPTGVGNIIPHDKMQAFFKTRLK